MCQERGVAAWSALEWRRIPAGMHQLSRFQIGPIEFGEFEFGLGGKTRVVSVPSFEDHALVQSDLLVLSSAVNIADKLVERLVVEWLPDLAVRASGRNEVYVSTTNLRQIRPQANWRKASWSSVPRSNRRRGRPKLCSQAIVRSTNQRYTPQATAIFPSPFAHDRSDAPASATTAARVRSCSRYRRAAAPVSPAEARAFHRPAACWSGRRTHASCLIDVGRRYRRRQRNALGIDQHMMLAPGLPRSVGFGPVSSPPSGALAKEASIRARRQSIWSAPLSSASSTAYSAGPDAWLRASVWDSPGRSCRNRSPVPPGDPPRRCRS